MSTTCECECECDVFCILIITEATHVGTRGIRGSKGSKQSTQGYPCMSTTCIFVRRHDTVIGNRGCKCVALCAEGVVQVPLSRLHQVAIAINPVETGPAPDQPTHPVGCQCGQLLCAELSQLLLRALPHLPHIVRATAALSQQGQQQLSVNASKGQP
jgi:hypothetical protein